MKVIIKFNSKYGRLTPIDVDKTNKTHVICVCDCGKKCSVNKYSLSYGFSKSCGCLKSEVSSETGSKTIIDNSRKIRFESEYFGTAFGIIENPAPDKRNKTGHKGVWYDEKHGVYEAYITLHKKRHPLGRYKDFAAAVSAREEAEEYFFAPIISAKNEMYITN